MAIVESKVSASLIRESFEKHQKSAFALRTEPIQSRKLRLKSLREWIHKNRSAIHEAMFNDFRKPALEVDAIEIFHVLNEIQHALSNLEGWAKPKKINAP